MKDGDEITTVSSLRVYCFCACVYLFLNTSQPSPSLVGTIQPFSERLLSNGCGEPGDGDKACAGDCLARLLRGVVTAARSSWASFFENAAAPTSV
jgi:hypothetical protein